MYLSRCYSAVTLLVGLGMSSVAMADSTKSDFMDPVALYGPEARYEILRNGDEVGEHRISFQRQGDAIIAEARSEIAVPFLFMTAYRFDYESRSVWRDGTMVGLDAVTSDDGNKSEVSIGWVNGKLQVTAPTGSEVLDAPVPPTEHWSKTFISQGNLINTITGRVNEVRLSKLSNAFVPTATGMARADRYLLAGDLNLETWYDTDGRWLGMRFQGKDGSTIEYRCRNCPAQLATAQ